MHYRDIKLVSICFISDDLIHDKCKHIVCIATNDTIIPFDINQGIIKVNKKCGDDRIEKIVFEACDMHNGYRINIVSIRLSINYES